MSHDLEGLVETSTNLRFGKDAARQYSILVTTSQRSSVKSRKI